MRLCFCLGLAVLWFSGAGWPVPERTEGLRIAIAHEMASQGNWVVPTLWGEPILTKPPAFYWSLMAAETILPGWGLAAYRMVSVAALLGIALLAAGFVRRTDEGRGLGMRESLGLAVLILPFSLAALGQLPSAEMDLAFSFWVVAFWLTALQLGSSPAHARSTSWFLLGWLGLGCLGGVAILFKWTAPAFFVPAGIWFWLNARMSLSRKCAATLLCALPMFALPASWLLAVGATVGWPALIETLLSEAMPHLSPAHHTRSYPFSEWITYPLQIFGMALPGTVPLLLKMEQGFRTRGWRGAFGEPPVHGLLFMILGALLLWTVIPGHRPRHALPIAFGLVVAALPYWTRWISHWEFFGRSGTFACWPRSQILALVCLTSFAAVKFGMSLGAQPGRQKAARVLAHAAMIRDHLLDGETSSKNPVLYLGKFKDDGLVYLVGVRALRWDPQTLPPGPVLCSSRDLPAFRQWNFASEMALLDQQGDPLYLLLKPQGFEGRRTDR